MTKQQTSIIKALYIEADDLSMSEDVGGDYVQILFEDNQSEIDVGYGPQKLYLLLQRTFEIPGPYYVECPDHDLCGYGHIEQLILKSDEVSVRLARGQRIPEGHTIIVHRKFTNAELTEVREMLQTIVSGYKCFIDETSK